MSNIKVDELLEFSSALLWAGGFSESDARATAELLVWANSHGVDSHGVLRIPRYIEMLEKGLIQSGKPIDVSCPSDAICIIEAGRAPGAVAMNMAVKRAAEAADKVGIGWCAVRKTSHAGAIGYFVEQLAQTGKVGIAATASKPLMSYYGARGPALSTNPLAIAIPRLQQKDPIILDMSTAAVALGKILAARDAGTRIPRGWGVDEEGVDTEDPHKVASILPMAGAKGSGLSLMIEILCSLLVDNANIAPVLNGGKPGGFNGLVLAIEPSFYGDKQRFLENVESLASALHGLDPASGVDKIRLPGERGYQCARETALGGIQISTGTAARLRECAGRYLVEFPKALGGGSN